MGQILTKDNLDAYLNWSKRPWGPADLLYERLPMLIIRNYLSCEDETAGPLCWVPGLGLRRGLRLCTDFLRAWQAFRPVAARTIRKRLQRDVPRRVLRVQGAIRDQLALRSIQGVSAKKAEQLAIAMAEAVADISACKDPARRKPMLGSKVMHFFLPEFFPVWDTAFVDAALRWLDRKGSIKLEARGGSPMTDNWSQAAETYAQYIRLMLADFRQAKESVDEVGEWFIERAIEEYNDKSLRIMVEENLGDLSPILFELCVIGYARKSGAPL